MAILIKACERSGIGMENGVQRAEN